MDPLSGSGQGPNPTNNPRLDLLHSTGDNQQLAGAAGSYGPATAGGPVAGGGAVPAPPPEPRPQPAPLSRPQPAAAPQSANSYISAAQARRPQAPVAVPPPPPPEPRAVADLPVYAGSVGRGGSDEDGGIGLGGIIVGVVILLLVFGGMYFMFSAQVSNQNKQIQAALNQIKNASSSSNAGGALGDITTSSIGNSGDLKTQTLEVLGASDQSQTSLNVSGSSEFQGPVQFDQAVTMQGNESVAGTVTAASFVGDGSQLTGLPSGAVGSTGSAGATGATGPEGAPNPDAVFATTADHATTADTATNCTTCVHLQGSGTDVGSISVTGSGSFDGNLVQNVTLPTPTGIGAVPTTGGSLAAGTYYFRVVAVNGSTLAAPSSEVSCTISGSNNACQISWTGSNLAASYRIYEGASGGGENQYFAAASSPYTLGSLSGGTASTPPSSGGTLVANDFGGSSSYIIGELGIGTTTPTTALDVVGGITTDSLNASANVSGGSLTVNDYNHGGGAIITVDHNGLSTFNGINVDDGNGITFTNGGDITGAGAISGSGAITGGSLNVGGGAISGGSLNAGSGLISGGGLNVSGGVAVVGSLLTNGTGSGGGSVNTGAYELGGVTIIDGSGDIANIGAVTAAGAVTAPTVYATSTFAIGVGGSEVSGATATGCSGSQHVQVLAVEGGIVTSTGGCQTGADYAESFNSTQSLSPGTVVAIDTANPSSVVATTAADQSTAIGVVSTKPGETIGTSGNTVVAEAGHVPVDVTDENGPIATGDYLTPSSTPGYAMKADPGDKTIAQAMAGFSGASGQVDAFIEISNGGAVTATTTPATTDPTNTQAAQTQPTQGSSDGSFADLNASGATTLNTLTVTGTATLASLTVTGTTTVADLVVNGHIVGNADTRGTLTVPAGATTATQSFATPYAAEPTVVASPTTSAVSYFVTATASGFTITLSAPAAAAQTFSYLVQQ